MSSFYNTAMNFIGTVNSFLILATKNTENTQYPFWCNYMFDTHMLHGY